MRFGFTRNETNPELLIPQSMNIANPKAVIGTPRSRGKGVSPGVGNDVSSASVKKVVIPRSGSASSWERTQRRYCLIAMAVFFAFTGYLTVLESVTFRTNLSSNKNQELEGEVENSRNFFNFNGKKSNLLQSRFFQNSSFLNTKLLWGLESDSDPEFTDDPFHRCTEMPKEDWPPPRAPFTGYLMVRANGGLNQMRAAICDMVAVARHLNAALVLPELDRTSFWSDPSQFGDVFNVTHFIDSLKDEVRIIRKLPRKYADMKLTEIFTMDPVSWSNLAYYTRVIKPLLRQHRVIRLYQTESRLANNPPGITPAFQKLRCRVQYHSLQFARHIRKMGDRLIRRLKKKGPYIALHLRYEMDMLSFTGCSHGCTLNETLRLTRLRFRTERWREKRIDGVKRRKAGDCPLTPEEVALFLRAMGYSSQTQIYIASGKIFGGKKRLARLLAVFPNTVRKEMMLTESELAPFRNHSTKLAALDYMATVAADMFMSTYTGNMARLVEGHRRYLGHRKTISPDRRIFVDLMEQYSNGSLKWDEFSRRVIDSHRGRVGEPQLRVRIHGKPKEEDNFFQNPEECMCLDEELGRKAGVKVGRKAVAHVQGTVRVNVSEAATEKVKVAANEGLLLQER